MRNTLLFVLAFASTFAAARAQDTSGFEVLYQSTGATDNVESSDALLLGSDGNFYGVVQYGTAKEGVSNGIIYEFMPATRSVTKLYGFSPLQPAPPRNRNPDGLYPYATPYRDEDGNLYGTAPTGGPNGNGIIYKLAPDGTYTKLHAFDATRKNYTNFDGYNPTGGLVRGNDGNFYGLNFYGGEFDYGTIYRITPDRVYTNLKSFPTFDSNRHNTDGAGPVGSLILARDGNFYGVTIAGGAHGSGTAFRMTPDGVFTTVFSFSGDSPNFILQGNDGNFYGATAIGADHGAVYKLTPDGVFTTLHTFDTSGSGPVDRNASPEGPMVQARDGNFYGTAGGGTNKLGVIFRLTPAGDYKVLYNFTKTTGGPYSGLTLGSDGRLYGTAGGSYMSSDTSALYALSIAPAITSAATVTAEVGRAFSYQITATNDPASYRAPGLPPGVSFSTKTGLLHGSPTQAGTFNATLQATNVFGTGSAPLTVTVQAAGTPFITSPATASGTKGQPFSYQITADNNPTRFAVVGLPGGLHVDAATGLISGTPTGFATYHLTLKAINAKGTGTATLTLTIARS